MTEVRPTDSQCPNDNHRLNYIIPLAAELMNSFPLSIFNHYEEGFQK